jgi:ligand-binding sensor domain-containing protein
VPGGEVFRGRRVDLILPADHGVLVSVRGEGLFLFDQGKATPFAPAASRWTTANRVMPASGLRLPDGRWALGSILGGLLLLRPDGAVDQVIDSSVGLPDDFVNDMVLDRDGSLWLALNNGLARVEVGSPVSVIDRRAGLEGSVYDMARHRGDLWVATAAGLFTADRGQAGEEGPTAADGGRPIRMREVPGVPPSAWSLLPVGDDLLVGTAFGVYVVHGDTPAPLPGGPQATVYAFARSAADPDRVWVGMEDGLAAIHRDAAGWRWEGIHAGTPRDVRTIFEGADGVLWCGTTRRGWPG